MTESMDNSECVICLDTCKNISHVSGCCHSFCFSCINNWSKVTNSCPVCKKEFSSITACNTPVNDGHNKKVVRVKRKVQRVAYDDDHAFLPQANMQSTDQHHARRQRRAHGYDFDADDLFYDDEASEAAYRRQSLQERLLASVYGAMNASASHSPIAGRGQHSRTRRTRNTFISQNEDHPHWIDQDQRYRDMPHHDRNRAPALGRIRIPSSRGSNRSTASSTRSLRLPTPRTYIFSQPVSAHAVPVANASTNTGRSFNFPPSIYQQPPEVIVLSDSEDDIPSQRQSSRSRNSNNSSSPATSSTIINLVDDEDDNIHDSKDDSFVMLQSPPPQRFRGNRLQQ